jgi:hypothetical protein
MNDDVVISYNLNMPPPTVKEAHDADKLALGIIMLAEKWNASPQVMLYALHRVLDKMGELAKSHG